MFFVFAALLVAAFSVGYLAADKDFLLEDKPAQGKILNRFNQAQKPKKDDNKLAVLTSEPIISFSLTDDKVKYAARNGQIIEVDVKTRTQKIISNNIIFNIFKITWSPDSRYLIYEVSRESGNRFILFDLVVGVKTDLDPNIESAAFSVGGTKLAYILRAGEVGTVFIRHSGSSEIKRLAAMRMGSIKLSWPKEELLRLDSTSSDGSEILFGLDLDGKLIKIDSSRIGGVKLEEGRDKVLSALGNNKKVKPGKIIVNEFGDYAIVQNELDKKLYRVGLK